MNKQAVQLLFFAGASCLFLAGCAPQIPTDPYTPSKSTNSFYTPTAIQRTPKDTSSITYVPPGQGTNRVTYGPYSERIIFEQPTRYGESGALSRPTLRAPLTVEYVMCKLQADGGYLWSFVDRNYAGREWKGSVHLALLSDTAEIYSVDVDVDQRNPISQEAYDAGGMLTQFETRTAPSSMGGNIVAYRYTVTPSPGQPTTGYINPASVPSDFSQQHQAQSQKSAPHVVGSAPPPSASQITIDEPSSWNRPAENQSDAPQSSSSRQSTYIPNIGRMPGGSRQ